MHMPECLPNVATHDRQGLWNQGNDLAPVPSFILPGAPVNHQAGHLSRLRFFEADRRPLRVSDESLRSESATRIEAAA
jgi:hypothetical protein